MSFVNRRYVSEYTLWMREQQTAHPEWDAEQTYGRALWWDKLPQDTEPQEAAKAYPYDVNFGATV
ncbi:hypothetical protein AGMMS49545_02380 [Betaproteobacteria bacterium]|nr:hypothetical protein AGMMS49545_02380 [Betaproteobacteria bacterium]GHU40548.1 hypothetical protein AGMMS50289_02240 [Betaproteobacteria bacterium]